MRVGPFGVALALLLVVAIAAVPASAGTVTWVPDADGAWTTATNWSSTPALPGAADDVTINVAGDRLITLSGGSTQTIKSLLDSERFALTNATLVVGTGAQFNNTVTISNNGKIRGGTLSTGAGGSIVFLDGSLDGVTVNAALDLTTVNNANVTLLNNLVLNNVMSLGKADGSTYGRAYLGTSATAAGSLTGTGSVLFGGTTNSVLFNESNVAGAAGTLTIGSGITVHGKSGQVLNDFANGTIVNQGTIAADVTGGTVIVGGSNGSFHNPGTISAATGTTLSVLGSWTNDSVGTVNATGATLNLGTNGVAWSNAGTITVNGTTLNVAGNVTQAGLGTINRTGGTVNLNGTLTGNLALTAATGSWVLNTTSSTLRNGTYTATDGSALLVHDGVLDNMVVNSPLDLTSVNNANATVLNGTLLNAVASLGKADGSLYGRLYYGTSATSPGAVAGTGSILFGGTSNDVLFNESNLTGAAGTLTIAPGMLIHGKTGQIINDFANGTLLNQGTIAVDVTGGSFVVNNGNGKFSNQGTVSAAAGTTLSIGGSWTNATGGTVSADGATLNLGTNGFAWSNAGAITVNNSTVALNGNITQAGLGTFNRTGGTVNLNGVLTGDLTLNAATGSWVLNAGGSTIRNGTYSATGGAALLVHDGVLDNVVVSTPLDLTTQNNANATVLNGTAINSVASLGKADGSTYGRLYYGISTTSPGTVAGRRSWCTTGCWTTSSSARPLT